MNNLRRKNINVLITSLDDIKAKLEEILYEEQVCYDNMQERLKINCRENVSNTILDALLDAFNYLDDTIYKLDKAVA